jgi:SOS response regulatory protein OraA/RecX
MKNINLFVPTFRNEEITEQINECLDKGWTGLGFKTVEIENKWKKSLKLLQNLAQKILKEDGCFVGKIFQGGSSEEILELLRQNFVSVKYFKPESSRKDSSETYLVARGFKVKEV